MTLFPKAAEFMALNPTLIGVVCGDRFYEHPTKGDESPLIIITSEGKKKTSDYWDMPSTLEYLGDLGL